MTRIDQLLLNLYTTLENVLPGTVVAGLSSTHSDVWTWASLLTQSAEVAALAPVDTPTVHTVLWLLQRCYSAALDSLVPGFTDRIVAAATDVPPVS
jgi:hypothetical protein